MSRVKVERGPLTLYPRARHSSVTDGKKFIYLIGTKFESHKNSVEKFDID